MLRVNPCCLYIKCAFSILNNIRTAILIRRGTSMKKSLSLLSILLSILTAFDAKAAEQYKYIRVFVPDVTTLQRMWASGIDHEGVEGKVGGPMLFVADAFALGELTRNGIPYEIVIDDLAKHYARQLSREPYNALGFGLGSMGGFYTFQEVLRQLDTMRLLYPHLVTVRDSIGRSQQGRALWAVKIGSAQSAGKPEVLYTALHHAREPQGMMSVLYYMWWLLENYATNPEAAYLVNNRQQWFIPVVNPDGYEYNRSTNPNGGGMWRKNRRDNGGGIYGVDLNRNYGPYYMWNANNGGSSTNPSSDTYRGPAQFSEPELQAIDAFMRSHNVKSCLNYHTYGNYLIYPWGYLSRENGDSLIYRDWAYDMTALNRFTNGTDQQTVAYSTRGNSDDYMFGDTTKPITYTMTPEVGTSEEGGFWPNSSLILPLAVKTLPMNKHLAYIAGHFTTVISYTLQDGGGDGFLNRGESFVLFARVKNKGLTAGSNVSVSATTNLSTVHLSSTPVVINPAPQQEVQVALTGMVSALAIEGIPLQVYLSITDADGYQKVDTLNTFLGTPTVLFADSASNGTSNWTTGSGWGLTANAHTPPYAFTDSPTGNYTAGANNALTMISQINLAGYNYAQLRFWTKWAVEPTWDFATVEISTNNGTSWTTLRTELSHFGSARNGSVQPAGSWGYDSYTPGGSWIEQSVNLSFYINRQIKLRFRMAADGSDQRDGFYVDDIRLYGYVTSEPPDTGIVVQPTSFVYNGVTGSVFVDSIKVKNMTAAPLTITLAESLVTSAMRSNPTRTGKRLDLAEAIRKLRPTFARANISRASLQTVNHYVESPNAYTTIITDERGETGIAAADIYSVQYQYRRSVLGNFHDFKFVMAPLPDTNVVIVLSVDTDQDFGTGRFPAPFGLGLTSRDVGSDREVLIDASGILIDSLLGFGRIPAGVVLSTENDTLTLVGLPFALGVTRDSVLTITTETPTGGINANWFSDPDRKMNLGVVATRLTRNANPFPDFAPTIGHGNVGGETGVSWLSQNTSSITLATNESTYVRTTTLAAVPAGTYRAILLFRSAGRLPVSTSITMNVTNPSPPLIQVSPAALRDTVALGDSVTRALSISNFGGSTLAFIVLDTAGTPWISVSPLGGSVDSGMTASVAVRLRSNGLQADTTYTSTVFVVSNDPQSVTVPVPVSLRVRRLTAMTDAQSLPRDFALHQNYPNPFNPATNIAFDLPVRAHATLIVFNLLGQQIAALLNAELEPGRYTVRVATDAFTLSSGVYFYRLEAHATASTNSRPFIATKKLIVLR